MENPKEIMTACHDLFNKLTQTIKKLEFSDLRNKLDNSLKQIKAKEKMEKNRTRLYTEQKLMILQIVFYAEFTRNASKENFL